MSMIGFLIGAAASLSGQSMVCEQAAAGKEPAKQFSLAFSSKGAKVSKIILTDPQAVLDPLADVPTLKPVSGGGPLVLKQSAAPARQPMNLTGRAIDGGYEFFSKAPALRLRLKSVDGSPINYAYAFEGNRLLSGIMRMGYNGNGSCAQKAADPGAQPK